MKKQEEKQAKNKYNNPHNSKDVKEKPSDQFINEQKCIQSMRCEDPLKLDKENINSNFESINDGLETGTNCTRANYTTKSKFNCVTVSFPDDPVKDSESSLTNPDKSTSIFTVGKTIMKCSKNKPSRAIFVPLSKYGCENRCPGPLVKLNVSGSSFHVKLETLRRDQLVFEKLLEDAEWLQDTEEYYIERDPVVFRFVLSFLRYNEMHLPQYLCGPYLEKELEAWGLQLGFDLQRCCLGPVMESKSKLESLEKFEAEFSEEPPLSDAKCITHPSWKPLREKVWGVIGDTPKKKWLNNSQPSVRRRSSIYEDGPYDSTQTLDRADIIALSSNNNNVSGVKQNCSNLSNNIEQNIGNVIGDLPLYAIDEEVNEHKPNEITIDYEQGNNSPWNYLQSLPRLVIINRIYIAYQSFIIIGLIILLMLSYIPSLRVNFGPEINVKNFGLPLPNSNLQLNFPVYRTYYSVNKTIGRATRPIVQITAINWICAILFTLDLTARAIFCPNILRWFRSVFTITDILSLVPYYIEGICFLIIAQLDSSVDSVTKTITFIKVMEIISILKLFVVVRLIRILQRHQPTRVLLYTIRTSARNMFILLELLALSTVFFGMAAFYLDSKFESFHMGMWWAIITMATVGYGDVTPSSPAGYVLAVICTIVGILLTSYTVPILVGDFLLYYSHADQLSWMKKIHSSAKAKRKSEKRTIMAKRTMSRIRSLLMNGIQENISHTKSGYTTQRTRP